MKIGNITVKYPLLLAPMAGVTDRSFRMICKNYGASIVYTEFVSADGIIRENQKTLDMIKFDDLERPIGVQIFGDDPQVVAESAQFIYENFKPDLSFINNKVESNNLIDLINSNINEYRYYLGKSLELKYVPQIKFYYDNTFEEMEHIHSLINKANKNDNI